VFVSLVADGWCWFVLREKYCWLIASGWFVVREKYCWLVADKPNQQAADGQVVKSTYGAIDANRSFNDCTMNKGFHSSVAITKQQVSYTRSAR
jgi:hypothetical protein